MSVPLSGQQTLERAQALLQSGRSTALPELLTLIETLSGNDASIPEITEIIEKDSAILGKVITLANTVAHNPGIAPVRTLSQAVHQVGYQRVRSMAVSLLLLENGAAASTPLEQREAAARALCAGLLAQGIAENLGTHDPELAFACASLRQFGRILMAGVSPAHFREAVQLAEKEPPEENCLRRRFGITSLELGRRVLSSARIPAEVIATLRDCEPEALTGTGTQHETRMLAIADFAGRLATLSLEPQSSSDGFVKRSRLLARRYARVIPEAEEHIKPAFRCADDRLKSYLNCKGVTELPTVSLRRVRRRLETVDPEVLNEGDGTIASIFAPPTAAAPNPPAEIGAPAALASPAPVAESTSAPTATVAAGQNSVPTTAASTPSAAPRAFSSHSPTTSAPFPSAALPAATPASATGTTPPFAPSNDPRLAALGLIRDGFGAQECWIFHRVADSTRFSGACGIGPWWSLAHGSAVLSAGERTVFGVCLARREPVLIHDPADAAIVPYLPGWLCETVGTRGSFVLVPLTEGNTLLGVALIAWHTPRRIALSAAQLMLARQVLSSVPMSAAHSRAA